MSQILQRGKPRWCAWRVAAGVAFFAGLSPIASSAKDFMVLNGKTVTCQEAFAFRDGPLFQSFDMLTSGTAAQKQQRRDKVAAELRAQIAGLQADWDAKSAAQKRALFASLATFAVAYIVKEYAQALPPGTDNATKQYAKVAMDRSVEMQKMLIDTGFGAPPSAASIAGLPFGTIAMAVPQLNVASRIYEIGVTGIDAAVLFGDLYLTNKEYEGQISALKAAIADIIANSNDLKIMQINKIKNEIDAICS